MKYYLVCICFLMSVIITSAQDGLPFQNEKLEVDERVNDLITRLTLKEKIAQMQDVAPAIDRLGIPEYNWWNECLHGVARAGRATSFPQAIGLAATWNTDLIHKVATAIGIEARAKYNHAQMLGQYDRYKGLTMWTPNINIFRDPRWGRGQETYGEDPYLTSRMAVAFVRGLQGDDPKYLRAIATPKHFAVHSGPEHNRHSFNAITDKRELYETYLPAFRAAVVEGKAFSVMSAYNRYLGASATASTYLLEDILRKEWGFKGYVVSDCGAVSDIYRFHQIVSTPEEAASLAVKAGCDLNCGNTYGHLEKAVELGLISETEIDIALSRLFKARFKLGILNGPEQAPFAKIDLDQLESEAHQNLALDAARESIVLLKNDGILPLTDEVKSITVVGPTADDRHVGLGNYFGVPSSYKTILDGIAENAGKDVEISYFKGTNLADNKPVFDQVDKRLFEGELIAHYFDNADLSGDPVEIKAIDQIDFEWGGAAPIDVLVPGNFSIKFSGSLRPDFTGKVSLGVIESGGSFTLSLDGIDTVSETGGNGNEVKAVELNVVKGESIDFELSYRCTNPWMASIQLVWDREHRQGREYMLSRIKESDVVVFAGGITARLEGEEMPVDIDGFHKGDRTHLKLPEPQLSLLEIIHALNPNTIGVFTTGSALALNWSQENLPAILNTWYGGQAGGQAVGDVLFGVYNPSGKLPVTFYKSVKDLPDFENYSMQGRTYRYFEKPVLYPFGYGLSYSDFRIGEPRLERSKIGKGETVKLRALLANNSAFDGSIVVQLYVSDLDASIPHPLKSLKKFQKYFLKAGEFVNISFEIEESDLSIVDEQGVSYVDPGKFAIALGFDSSTDNVVFLEVFDR